MANRNKRYLRMGRRQGLGEDDLNMRNSRLKYVAWCLGHTLKSRRPISCWLGENEIDSNQKHGLV